MCGVPAGQQQLGDEELQAYQEAQQLTQEQYGNQQAILAPMAKQFQSIFDMGPNQEGFSAPEEQTLNSQVLEGTAENYKQASAAVREGEAAEGGGTNPLPSGAQEAERESVAESAAQEESRELNQVEQSGFQQGYNEFETAAEGLGSVASAESPLGYEANATSSGNAAASTESEIANEQNSWVNAAIGAAGAVASAAATPKP